MVYLCFDYKSAPLDCLLEIIPKTERKRIETEIKNREKKLQSAAAWAILSLTLRLNDGNETARTPDGKPYVVGKTGFFSLSHCKTCVAVAVSDSPVGIDAETVEDTYPTAVAERIFSSEVCEKIAESAAPAEAFFLKWTQYESFLKTFGANSRFSEADGSLFLSRLLHGTAISVCGTAAQKIKILPISAVLLRQIR